MNTIHCGDALDVLQGFDDEQVDCIVTSPPYFGLRNYDVDGQIGLEPTVQEYVCKLVEVFREARRVLKNDGTFWLNLGDSYAGSGAKSSNPGGKTVKQVTNAGSFVGGNGILIPRGFRSKQLMGIPWRVTFALQDDGWLLRSDIIWHKPNPMPSSVKDRPTSAHEYVFLFAKQSKYWYDADAIKTPAKAESIARQGRGVSDSHKNIDGAPGQTPHSFLKPRENVKKQDGANVPMANARSVWSINVKGYKDAHFATFPEELARRCIVAGCPEGGTVLDPFFGAGTTGKVAKDNGRYFAGIELNPEYVGLSVKRVGEPVEVFGV